MNPEYTINQVGKIYLWKYKVGSNFPGYHMAWSSGGQENFEQFLTVLANAEIGFYRTLRVTKPTSGVLAVPNNKFNKVSFISKLKLEISDVIDWSFNVDGEHAHIIMSLENARNFSRIIPQVRSQVELYFEDLSFWW
jgi:hypothetical protein